jgi:F-type H+-transporting ATPase subunit b
MVGLVALFLIIPFVLSAGPQEHAAEKPALHGAGPGPAAEASHEAGGGSGMAGKLMNFAILFGGLFFLLRKPLMAMLAQRTADVTVSLDAALAARREAEARLAEARAKVGALEAVLGRLRTEAEEEGRREKERIRTAAAQEAERLRTLARLEVEGHLKAGVRDLKAYTAELAASLAEERLKARLTAADQAALIDKSIAKLKSLHEESDSR